ncbi:MAG: bifunctional diaminohydroxyphosphoribosylaminopyrimidine deaminase/5-amino-6-(5-phosphoribosylamino)uracil reductase RibD [Phycisphaerales bacterium]|nr:bifunctional diaminohydroxyphosphoribosylaminopyrimidine deaminase/5-amino-6-(5-phosphoribosylamino)uracil reductase RibD [Phycisphaerales bacterium]
MTAQSLRVADDGCVADERHMRRALALARRGLGRVEPNPMVGCVLVRNGRVVGEGYHRRFGRAHAEVEALHDAGRAARGATVYVTLEPCAHTGKTPPCTDALIRAGVAHVVAAVKDPNPLVAGKGVRALQRAGIRVDVGLLESDVRELNAPYLKRVETGRPYVILKWAQSLDGRIATPRGGSPTISGPEALRWVHRLRARVDGIIVGIGTVLADDPQLTARDVPIRRVATRIVLDSNLRTPPGSRLVRSAGQTPVVLLATEGAMRRHAKRAARLTSASVEIVTCRPRARRIDLTDALDKLGRRGMTNLLIEGGAEVIAGFLAGRLVDEAVVFISPMVVGAATASVRLPADAFSAAAVDTCRMGCDAAFLYRFPAATRAGRD